MGRIGRGADLDRCGDLALVLGEHAGEACVVGRLGVVHDAELPGLVLHVVAAVLRLLAGELLADDLGAVDRARLALGRVPAIGLLRARLARRRGVAHDEDLRLREPAFEHAERREARRWLRVHDGRERLHRFDRHEVGTLGGLVVAGRLEELDLDVTAPRLEEPHLRQQVVVERVLIGGRRGAGALLGRDRIRLLLLVVRDHRDDGDLVLRHALGGRAAVVRAGLPRLDARRGATELGGVEPAVRPVLGVVVTTARVVERGLRAHTRRGHRRSRALRTRDGRGGRRTSTDCGNDQRRTQRHDSQHHHQATSGATRTTDHHGTPQWMVRTLNMCLALTQPTIKSPPPAQHHFSFGLSIGDGAERTPGIGERELLDGGIGQRSCAAQPE